MRLIATAVLAWLLMQAIDIAVAQWRHEAWTFRPYLVLSLLFAVVTVSHVNAYRRIRIEPAGIDDGRVFIAASDLLGPPERRSTRFGGDALRFPVRTGLDRPVRLGGVAQIPLDAYDPEDRPRIVAAVAALFESRRATGVDGGFSPEAMAIAAARREHLPQRVEPRTFRVSVPAIARVLSVYAIAFVLAALLARSIPVARGMDPALVWLKVLGDLWFIPIPLTIYTFLRLRAVRLGPTALSCGTHSYHLTGIAGPVELRPGRWWREPRLEFDYDYDVTVSDGGRGRRLARRRLGIPVGQLAPADRIALRDRLAAIVAGGPAIDESNVPAVPKSMP